MLTHIFDGPVAAAELSGAADASLLYPAEAAVTAGFAPKRIADFTAGRLCARRAIAELGFTDFPIAVNPDRSPRWPSLVVGSISHTSGYCCAVAANEREFASIGVDAELVGRVTTELYALVFTQSERTFLSSLTAADEIRAATIIFSAKEAFYKCQYVLTRQWLDFHDVTLELVTGDMHSGSFSVQTASPLVLPDNAAAPLRGRFHIDRDLVLTGIALRR